jgi:hypothetical protein
MEKQIKEYFKERKKNTLNQLSSINEALSNRNKEILEIIWKLKAYAVNVGKYEKDRMWCVNREELKKQLTTEEGKE